MQQTSSEFHLPRSGNSGKELVYPLGLLDEPQTSLKEEGLVQAAGQGSTEETDQNLHQLVELANSTLPSQVIAFWGALLGVSDWCKIMCDFFSLPNVLYGRSESIKRNITVIVAQSKHNASSFKFGICYPTELTHWKRPWCWEGLGAGGEGADRGWDGWMASLTRRTWVWVNSGSWWWTGRPGVLRFMGSQRVGHDWATELTELNPTEAPVFNLFAIQFGDRCPRTHITGSGTGLAQKGGWRGRGLASAGSEMAKHKRAPYRMHYTIQLPEVHTTEKLQWTDFLKLPLYKKKKITFIRNGQWQHWPWNMGLILKNVWINSTLFSVSIY